MPQSTDITIPAQEQQTHTWCETDCNYPRLWGTLGINTQHQEHPSAQKAGTALLYGDRLREWGVFSLEKAPGGSHCGLSILKGDLNLGTDFLVGTAAIEKGEVALN